MSKMKDNNMMVAIRRGIAILPVCLLAFLPLLFSCSSDDDNVSNTRFEAAASEPAWAIDWTWHDAAPDWENPADSLYESYMYVILKLDDALSQYSTDGDLMGLFNGDECRGVAKRNVMNDGTVCFFIMVAGGENDDETRMTIKYYNAKLKQICVLPGFTGFLSDFVMGDTWDIIIPLGEGNPKYQWLTQLKVEVGAGAPFTPSNNDLIGVFINGECRGTGRLGERFFVWGNTEHDKSFELRYYSTCEHGIYTFNKPFQITEDLQDLTITFN